MISRSQEEIMQDWPAKWNAPVVSVRCTTYNHEPYIAQALDSFLVQKTNFPFEIVVHDDASTDKTADIIREYEMKYPQIIKPIYEIENQYSKRDGSLGRIANEACKGDYIAFCEGDDYWCHPDKLQMQFDFLCKHPNYSACVHNTKMINLLNGDELILYECKEKILHTDFFSKEYHLNSLMCKRDYILNMPKFKSAASGDIKMETYLKILGPIYRFGCVMSVYRLGVPNSWSQRIGLNKKKAIENSKKVLDYYMELQNWAPESFRLDIARCIDNQKFLIYCKEGCFIKAIREFPQIWKEKKIKDKIRCIYDAIML